ncbi:MULTISPECIES: hypothetical protein [Burkholderia]|nr:MULTISPECIES: hypothetical protein [Burkholderia]MCA8203301.1 hypothetical protein [Burkholderia sp. AU33545]
MDFQPVGCCKSRRRVAPGAAGVPVIDPEDDPGIDPVCRPEFYRNGD